MGFKVTVHRNGAKHGEAHYSSEAVAVGMAKKMRNAGADVSVARCNGACCCDTKANPRRRNGTTSAALEWDRMRSLGRGNRNWETVAGLDTVGFAHAINYKISHDPGGPFRLSASLNDRRLTNLFRDLPFPTLAAAKAAAVEHAMEQGVLARANPRRRNGTTSARQNPSKARMAQIAAGLKRQVESGKISQSEAVTRYGDAYWPTPKTPKAKSGSVLAWRLTSPRSRYWIGNMEFGVAHTADGNPINYSIKGEPQTKPTTPYAQSAMFHVAADYKGKGIAGDPDDDSLDYYTHDLGVFSSRKAAKAAAEADAAARGAVVKTNPRRRRNGTTAANAAASRSLVHRAGLMWNRR